MSSNTITVDGKVKIYEGMVHHMEKNSKNNIRKNQMILLKNYERNELMQNSIRYQKSSLQCRNDVIAEFLPYFITTFTPNNAPMNTTIPMTIAPITPQTGAHSASSASLIASLATISVMPSTSPSFAFVFMSLMTTKADSSAKIDNTAVSGITIFCNYFAPYYFIIISIKNFFYGG
ncbi:MAG: hypothetical protein ACOC5T_06055 [Elusimicrobiota bacterium]